MPKPNILIILADDLGVDSFRIDKNRKSVTAHVKSVKDDASVELPTFEKLLKSGVHFEQAWANPVCTPTRACLWTGIQPWKTGMGYPSTTGKEFLPDITVTGSPFHSLAQAIKQQQSNYRCAMFGKWDLGSGKNPVQLGWDYFAGIFAGGLRPVGVQEYGFPRPPNRVGYDRLLKADGSLCKSVAGYLAGKYDVAFLRSNPDLRYYIWHKDVVASDGTVSAAQPPTAREIPYATADQVADAKKWIAAQAGSPWCVALNLITPHDPLHLPPPESYQGVTIDDPANPTVQEMLVAMIKSMDYYVNDLLTAIDSQLANTVVIFVGDNGTQDIDPDTLESVDLIVGDDKNSIAIGGVHVPMIIADGGLMKGGPACYTTTAPRSVAEPVHIIDIYRTALDIAGVTPTLANDSISLAPHLTGAAGVKRAVNFSQIYIDPQPPASPAADDGTRYSPTVGAAAGDGSFHLSCSALLGKDDNNNTYLVDEQGNKVQKPVYGYQFSRLDPEPDIPGSLIDTQISAILRCGSTFAISDQAYRDKILQLYATLAREYLDNHQTPFPAITDKVGAIQASQANSSYLDAGNVAVPVDFTFEAWIRPDSLYDEMLIMGKDRSFQSANQFRLGLRIDGRPYFMMSDGNGAEGGLFAADYQVQATATAPAGSWTHVALTKSGAQFTLYVNGVACGAFTASANLVLAGALPLRIGARCAPDGVSPDAVFNGSLREVRLWNSARTAGQIAAAKDRSIGSAEAQFANLIAYWKLDEGAGTVAADATGKYPAGLVNNPDWTA
jgi:arylsulfatase A-like enzyme